MSTIITNNMYIHINVTVLLFIYSAIFIQADINLLHPVQYYMHALCRGSIIMLWNSTPTHPRLPPKHPRRCLKIHLYDTMC